MAIGFGETAVDGGGSRAFGNEVRAVEDEGCAFILDGGAVCREVGRPGSAYCEAHHRLCHLPGGSAGERRKLRETEVLAAAVGGRRGRPARTPPDRFLRRLEAVARGLARPKCSRIVRKEQGE
jgi:hypothetical protein